MVNASGDYTRSSGTTSTIHLRKIRDSDKIVHERIPHPPKSPSKSRIHDMKEQEDMISPKHMMHIREEKSNHHNRYDDDIIYTCGYNIHPMKQHKYQLLTYLQSVTQQLFTIPCIITETGDYVMIDVRSVEYVIRHGYHHMNTYNDINPWFACSYH